MTANNQKSKVNIEINHQEYTVVTHETQAYVEELATILNEKIQQIKENNHTLDTKKVAVLTALNVMDDYIKLKKEYDTLLQLIEEDN